MENVIVEYLQILFSASDTTQISASEQALCSLASEPQFLTALNNIILNHQNPNIQLSAILFLKSIVSKGVNDPKQIVSNLVELIKQHLSLQLKKILADTIRTVLEKLDSNDEIRKILVKQAIIEFKAVILSPSDIDLGQIEYNLILIQMLCKTYDQISRVLLEGVLEPMLNIGLYLVKQPQMTEKITKILKLITQIFQQIFNLKELQQNIPFQALCVNLKFEQLIYNFLTFFCSEICLIVHKDNVYTNSEVIVNQIKSNTLFLLSRCAYYSASLHFDPNSLVKYSPFMKRINEYIKIAISTLKTIFVEGIHFKHFKFNTLIKGTDQILRLLLCLVKHNPFYNFFSDHRWVIADAVSKIVDLTEQQKNLVIDQPEQLIELATQIMKGGHHLEVSDFFHRDKYNELSTRVIAGRLLIQVVKYIDGVLAMLFQHTCENVLHQTLCIDVPLKQRCILLLGIICNCIQGNDNLMEKVDDFIGQEIESIYEAYQCSKNHKVQLVLKFIFITLYFHVLFQYQDDERHCQQLFMLVQKIFQGGFQPAVENPALIFASYYLLKSLLALNNHYINHYTQSLLNYFNKVLESDRPSLFMLRSLGELCNQNKALEVLTDSLLECLKKLTTHIHKQMQQIKIDSVFVDEGIDVLALICSVKPMTQMQEWKLFAEQNLLSLTQYFTRPIAIEEKVVKIVLKLIRTYKTINVQELKLIGFSLSFFRSHHRLGAFYDLISLSMIFGDSNFQSLVELPNKVAELCLEVLTLENVLPSEMMKAIILVAQLFDISYRFSIPQTEIFKQIFNNLMSIYQKVDTPSLIKYNIIGIFGLILCFEYNSQLYQVILKQHQNRIKSVFACKILTVAFCTLIVKYQTNIPDMFSIVISLVVYICSFEGKIFKLGESDDEEDYYLEKEKIIENIFDQKWLDMFHQTHFLILENSQLYATVLDRLNQFEKVELEKIKRLRITKFGVRQIRKITK